MKHCWHVNILTLFPEALEAAFSFSILQRARQRGFFKPRILNIRDFSRDRHRIVDDKPYGGGCGMVLKIAPIARALAAIRRTGGCGRVYLLAPGGKTFDQAMACEFSRVDQLTLICGRYEGIDERVAEHYIDGEISLGDFVLTGGEPAAVAIADAVVRLIPGVLGDDESAKNDSFSDGLLDYPHYTRPERYRGWSVPEVLKTGNHKRIAAWRRKQQLIRTFQKRPDLLVQATLRPEDHMILGEWRSQTKLEGRVRRRSNP